MHPQTVHDVTAFLTFQPYAMQTELSTVQINAILQDHCTAHAAFFDGLLPFVFPLHYLLDGNSLLALIPPDKVTKRIGHAQEICLEIDEGRINAMPYTLRVWGKTRELGSHQDQKKARLRFAERLQIPLQDTHATVSRMAWDMIRLLQDGLILRILVSFKSGYCLERDSNDALAPIPNIIKLPVLKPQPLPLKQVFA